MPSGAATWARTCMRNNAKRAEHSAYAIETPMAREARAADIIKSIMYLYLCAADCEPYPHFHGARALAQSTQKLMCDFIQPYHSALN
jgi:hypothetical protein